MKQLAVAAILLISLISATAWAGGLPLKVPDGWDSRTQEGTSIMVPKGVGDGRFYTVVVPPLARNVGSVRGLLDAAKANLAEAGTFSPATEPARGRNDQGWEYDVVIGSLEKDGKTLFAEALGIKKGEEEGIILVISDSVETLQKYSDAFTAMIKTMGSSAAPAPPTAAATGTSMDVKLTVPAGWTTKPLDGAILLEQTVNTMYDKYSFRVVVFASQPLRDSLRKTYLADWASTVVPALETTIAPLPLMRRLKSGTAVAYDVDSGAKTKDGQVVHGGLFVVAQGTRYFPVLVVFFGGVMGGQLENDLTNLLDSAEIPGAGHDRVALFSPSELVGEWNESSTSYASYVTSAGAYAGDATISTGSTMVIKADNTFRRTLVAMKDHLVIKERDEGTWRLDDMSLVQTGKGKQTNQVFGVGVDAKAGAFLVLSPYSAADPAPKLCNPRGVFQGTWYKRKE